MDRAHRLFATLALIQAVLLFLSPLIGLAQDPSNVTQKILERHPDLRGESSIRAANVAKMYQDAGQSGVYPPYPYQCGGTDTSIWKSDSAGLLNPLVIKNFLGCFGARIRPSIPIGEIMGMVNFKSKADAKMPSSGGLDVKVSQLDKVTSQLTDEFNKGAGKASGAVTTIRRFAQVVNDQAKRIQGIMESTAAVQKGLAVVGQTGALGMSEEIATALNAVQTFSDVLLKTTDVIAQVEKVMNIYDAVTGANGMIAKIQQIIKLASALEWANIGVGCGISKSGLCGWCGIKPVTEIEICNDPPIGVGDAMGVYCPSNRDLLQRCGVDKSDMTGFNMLTAFGHELTFYWPENQVQVGNYNAAPLDPDFEEGNADDKNKDGYNFKNSYLQSMLLESPALHAGLVNTTAMTRAEAGMSPDRQQEMHALGHWAQSGWAGISPGDQTYQAEAHVYRTYLNTLAALNNQTKKEETYGYKRNCKCFYSSLDTNFVDDNPSKKRRIVNGWTELPKFLPYWRTPYLSNNLNSVFYEAINDFSDPITNRCDAYRAYRWPEQYGGWTALLGVKPEYLKSVMESGWADKLSKICYRGGGELFPVTGQNIGNFSVLASSAYLARKALYLFGRNSINIDGEWVDMIPPERQINRFKEGEDKLQRIFPVRPIKEIRDLPIEIPGFGVSACFSANQIPNYLEESTNGKGDWPSNLMGSSLISMPSTPVTPGGPMSDARFVYWNKRKSIMCPFYGPLTTVTVKINLLFFTFETTSCHQRNDACRPKDSGDAEEYSEGAAASLSQDASGGSADYIFSVLAIWMGVPYPFMPVYQQSVYQLERSVGGGSCQLEKKSGGDAKKKANEFFPEDPTKKGGLMREQGQSRCDI